MKWFINTKIYVLQKREVTGKEVTFYHQKKCGERGTWFLKEHPLQAILYLVPWVV